MAIAISLIVIAISWIVFRPILGICLLAGAIILVVLAKKMGTKKDQATSQASGPIQQNPNPYWLFSNRSQSLMLFRE